MLEIRDNVSKQLNTIHTKGLVVFKHLIADYVVISSQGQTMLVAELSLSLAR